MYREKLLSLLNDRPLTILLLFFLLSVVIRLPNLNRPLSKHHELNPALVLINAEEWNRKTASFYKYVPVHSYHHPGDDVFNLSNNQVPQYLVNVSFGTLWYIMPYVFFQLLHAEPSPLLLQVFNLLLHLITLVLIYKLALYLFAEEAKAKYKALLTSVIYLFSPSPLWFHGNGYVHEIAVLPFIYAAILLYIHLDNQSSISKFVVLSILVTAGICCDWLMCFVAAAMFAISIYNYRQKRDRRSLLLIAFLITGVVTGLVITVLQFTALMGFQNYMDALMSRFLLRGITGTVESGGLLKSAGIGTFYLLGYGLLIPLIIYGLFKLPFKKKFQVRARLRKFIILAVSVCLFHHLIFWGFTNIHDYTVVKSGLIISLLSTVTIFSINTISKKVIVTVAVLTMNISLYYYINRPGNHAANGQPYAYFKNLGEKIRSVTTPEDYIFIDTPEMSLLLTYYSKRFYRNVNNVHEADAIFRALPGRNAIFIRTNNFDFVSYLRLRK